MKHSACLIVLLMFCISGFAQTFLVSPFIQNADSTSVVISWETDAGTESLIRWGTGSALGSTANGTTTSGASTAIVHEVFLSGLTPDTRYFYKAITGATESDTFSFRTFPSHASDSVIRIVAISDCQFDGNEPQKLYETINDGIMAYCQSEYGAAPIENLLNLCLLVGDNVNSGNDIAQWRNEFFINIQNLGHRVCLLPVIGNHEGNDENYFAYFNLPQNGPVGYSEHTYYKDLGNTRIIGFDSNFPYAGSFQLDWLSTLLNNTGVDGNIDFVVFQEHHPYLSEMWLAGETDFARQVLDSLEQFNLTYGKPVVFLFGHTHGYSRGQMKESKVAQINTATASGYIDKWGSTPQADYPAFNMSFDEYGFTLLEITSGVNPEMIIRRISRGDTSMSYNNLVKDSLVLRPGSRTVNTPQCLFPTDGRVVHPECVELRISKYISTGDSLGAVEYQISLNNTFTNLVYQNWKHSVNWYFDNNTQYGDSLNTQMVYLLAQNTLFYWRARYRTENLDWSPWSAYETFITGSAGSPVNLLSNSGAEDGTLDWTVTTGILESLQAGECAGINPHNGTYYFGIGGLCTESAYAEAFQDIDVSSFSTLIDNDSCLADWGAWMSDYAGYDIPAIRLLFLDAGQQCIDSTSWMESNKTIWTLYQQFSPLPPLTRKIRFVMSGTRNSGTDNDSYTDDLFLHVIPATPCNEYITTGIRPCTNNELMIFPVPASQTANLYFTHDYSGGTVTLYSLSGNALLEKTVSGSSFELDCSNYAPGIYLVSVQKSSLPVLHGKLIVQ